MPETRRTIVLFIKIKEKEFMNRQECDILQQVARTPFVNQRTLAEQSKYSLGTVNQTVRALTESGYLTDTMELTLAADEFLKNAKAEECGDSGCRIRHAYGAHQYGST